MSSSPSEIVRRYFAAWPAGDRAAVEALVAADFHFTSPLDNRLDRDTFFRRCWPNSESMASLDLERIVVDGDTVFVTYSLTEKDGRRFRNSEVITVRGRQVVDVEVYFGWGIPHKAPTGGFIDKENA